MAATNCRSSTNPTDCLAHCPPDVSLNDGVHPRAASEVKPEYSVPESPSDGQAKALVHATPVLLSGG